MKPRVRRKQTTIKDIARAARVTHPTVSRVIHGDPAISEKTRARVLRAIEQLDYQPNLIARSLVRSRSRSFALIAPELSPYVLPILRGIADSCRRHGYGLMLFSTDTWSDEALSCGWVLRNWLVDGILIYNVSHHAEVPEKILQLHREKVPMVFINKYLGHGQVSSVGIDQFAAVNHAVRHLAAVGSKRIAVVNGSQMAVDGVERFKAFQRAMAEARLELDPSLVAFADFRFDRAFEETKRLLYSGTRRPDAFFCANDEMAMGVIRAVQEEGLKVPDDVAVIGFDDLEAGRYFQPSLSTICPPLEVLGGKAIDVLVAMIEDPEATAIQVPFPSRLIIRDSSSRKTHR